MVDVKGTKPNHDKVIRFFMRLQNNILLYHWSTRSYNRHRASDDLYTNLATLVDKYMEVYFGKYGRPGAGPGEYMLKVSKINDVEMVMYMRTVSRFMENNKAMFCPNKDADLGNVLDEMITETNRAVYLMKTN